MPSLKLSNPFRRGADRPSLKERAASLRATATRVMRRRPADPFEGTSCPEGFVPYPFDKPIGYFSIGHVVIPAEAQKLLDLALDEYERVCGSFPDFMGEDQRESIRQASRDLLCLDALAVTAAPSRSAPPASPDAGLLALGAQWKAADAAYRASMSRADNVEEAASIDPPAAVYVQPGDDALGIAVLANGYRGDEGAWYSIAAGPFLPHHPPGQAGALRKPMMRLVEVAKPRPANSPAIPIPHYQELLWPEAQARADEICAAFDRWKAEEDAAREATGIAALEGATAALGAEAARLEDAISAATALTVEGVRLQAEIALQCEHHVDGEERAWAVIRALLTVA